MISEKICTECGSELIKDGWEFFCESCGVVHEVFLPKIDEEYDEDRVTLKTQTTGSFDRTIQTYVGDYSEIKTYEHMKLKKQNRSLRYQETSKHYTNILINIQKICAYHDLPSICQNNSIFILNKLAGNGFAKGKNKEAYSVAIVYFSCREYRIPYTPNELAFDGVHDKEVKDIYRKLCRNMKTGHLPYTVNEFIVKYINSIDTDVKLSEALGLIKGVNVSGRSPLSLCGAVFLLLDDDLTANDITNVLNITRQSIQTNKKWLENKVRATQ